MYIDSINTNIMSKNEQATNVLIDKSLGILQIPEVSHRLGDYNDQLTRALNRVTHSNVNTDGFLELRAEADTIPVVIRSIGEYAVLHARDSAMNPHQIGSLSTQIGFEKATVEDRKFRSYLSSTAAHKALPVFEDRKDMAVKGSNWWLPEPRTIVKGRPYVSMNGDAAIGASLSPVVFLHELMHVLQTEANPVGSTDELARNKVRGELEAYHIAAQIILGMEEADRHHELLEHTPRDELDRALDIELVRINSQDSSDHFEPNDKVVSALVRKQHAITSEISDIIRKVA
jgi:AraC-like DNA-binding protein